MRNSTFLKSLFLLCALIVGSGTAWAADTWVKTAPADLKTGDVVVIVDQTSVTAMSNDNGTSNAPAATGVTLNGDKSEITSSVADNLQWVVTVTDGSYQFGVAGTEKFLYCIKSNNGVRVGTNANNAFTITQGGDDDADFLLNTETGRYLGVYNSQDWRCYTSINSNIKACVTAFYKKTSDVDPGKTKADPALTVEENVELYVGQQKAVSEFYLIEDDYAGVMSFESSDETVAKVEGDVLKALAVGTAVITVTAAADANYKAATATFTVTVKSMDVTPEGSNASSFVKVTDTEDITDGQYLIVYEVDATHAVAFDGSLETLDAANKGIDVTLAGSKIAATSDLLAATFYIDVTNGTLLSASGQYIGVSSNSNGLKQTDNAETYTNSFTIDESDNAVIAAVFEGSTMTLRYNKASDQQRFRYYKSGQEPIALYKYVDGSSFDITIKAGFDGYRTLVSAVDAMLPDGLKAYIVTKVESGTASGTATLTEVPTIKANTPYILIGTAEETYTLTGADGVQAPEGNLLKISDSNTGNGVYVLAKPAGKEIGFYKWTGGSLGAGRVYLDTTTAAPDFIGFSSETTGIAAVTNNTQTTTGGVYNLQGQRVSQPTKGLFIVNGKKVVVK